MAKETKTTKRRKSTRADGRLSTIVYLRPDMLDELQALAKRRDTTAWRVVETVLEEALKKEEERQRHSARRTSVRGSSGNS